MAHFSLSPLSCAPSPLPPRRRIFLSPPRAAASSATDVVSTSTSTSSSASNFAPKVVVTRERGKNAKLIAALVRASVHSLHISHLRFVFLQLHCNVLNLSHSNSNQLVVPFFFFRVSFSFFCYFFLQYELVFPRFLFHLFRVCTLRVSGNWTSFRRVGVWLKVEVNGDMLYFLWFCLPFFFFFIVQYFLWLVIILLYLLTTFS